MERNSYIFLLIVILGALGAFKVIQYVEYEAIPLPIFGDATHEIPIFELQNQLDQPFSSADHLDQIWVVNYFFTSCPSVCPKMTRELQEAHNILRNSEEVMFMSITVDPKRDQPDRLKRFADNFQVNHKTWQFLTGPKEVLYRLARSSFLVSASEGAGDEFDFIHSENVVILDKDQKVRAIIKGTDKSASDEILDTIKKLLS